MSRANRYEAQQETKEAAHSNAVRELATSRKRAKQALTFAESQGVPPYQTIVDPKPPKPPRGMNPDPRRPDSDRAGALRGAHAATLEFWDELRPYRGKAPDKWEQTLEVAMVPVEEEEWTRHSRDYDKDYYTRGVEREAREVSLKDLSWWRYREVTLAVKHPDGAGKGDTIEDRTEKVHLPVIACHRAYEKMNDILEDLGLAAEVRDREATDTDPGRPEDLEAWKNGDH